MLKIPARGRHITKESQAIAPHLLGIQLATFRRRMTAFIIDTFIFGILVGTIFITTTYISFDREDPTFFPRIMAMRKLTDDAKVSAAKNKLAVDFFKMVDRRCPEAFDSNFKAGLQSNDAEKLKEIIDGDSLTLGFGNGDTKFIDSNGQRTLSLGMDLILGSSSNILSWGAFFVVWFTFWHRIAKGRSPAKFMLRIQVIRLDGNPLTWWDSFSRAGGYGASAATLFLGFLEAIFHPNRQAIHDRIASTVVIRK